MKLLSAFLITIALSACSVQPLVISHCSGMSGAEKLSMEKEVKDCMLSMEGSKKKCTRIVKRSMCDSNNEYQPDSATAKN